MYAKNLYDQFVLNNGFTRNWLDEEPTSGYVVGMNHPGNTEQTGLPSYSEFEYAMDEAFSAIDNELDSLYEKWTEDNSDTDWEKKPTWHDVANKYKTTHTYGAWYETENNTFYLDIGRIFTDLDEAIEFAKSQDQIALYDLSTHTTIYV